LGSVGHRKGTGDKAIEVYQRAEEQIIAVLWEQQGGKAAEICRKHGISEATLYRWKAMYGEMEMSDTRWPKALEEVDPKLRKLLAEAILDNTMPAGRGRKKMGDARCQTRGRRSLAR
jgi:putative transposase